MKKIYLLFFILSIQTVLMAQVSRDVAVELIAVTDSAKHSITLQWWPDKNCTINYIYKQNSQGAFTKVKTAKNTDTTYVDTNISVGQLLQCSVLC